MADTSLLFNIIGRDRTGPAFRSAADGASKLGGKMKVGLLAGAAALGGASVAAFALGKDMVNIASNTSEALSKTNTVFGKAADAALKFSDTSASSYGISKRAALDYTSGMGSVLVAMGDSQDAAAKTSVEYTKLAADMASFNNTSIEEAATALKASLTGEFEQMKKYGVVINDTRLAQEAQAMGMKKDGATWTAQQKKILSHSIILKDTAQAQGDFTRTSGGMANQQRILSARMEDLKGKMGEKLLPVVVKVMGWLNKGIDIAYRLGHAVSPVVAGIQAFTRSLMGNSDANEGMTGNLRKMSRAGIAVSLWIRNDFLPAARRFGSWLKNEAIPAVRDFATKLWNDLQPTIRQLAATLRKDIIPAVQGFIGKLREAWPTAKRVLTILGNIASFILRRVVPVLIQFYGKYLATLIRVFGEVFSAAYKVVSVFLDLVTGAKNAGAKVISFFKNLPGNIVSAVGDLAGKLVQKGKDLIQGFINGIEEKARDIPFGLGKMLGAGIDMVHKVGEFGSPSRLMMKYGRWFVEGFSIGMKDKTDDVIDKAQQLVDKLKEKLSEVKDFARQIRDTFSAFGDVTSIETLISGDAGDTEGGFAKLLADLQGRAANAKQFDSSLAQLRKMGLNETTMRQLREAGPEQGLKSAQQILGAGVGGIGQVNAAVRSILASGSSLGNREAKALYEIDPSKSQKLQMKIGGHIKVSADVNSFIKVLRQEIRAQGGNVQKVLGKV